MGVPCADLGIPPGELTQTQELALIKAIDYAASFDITLQFIMVP
jgi:hypothetical protein